MKIAILEDLKDVALLLKDIFSEQEDMACSQVYYNAEDAMKFLPKNPADVLVVDIGLPKTNGIDAMIHLSQYCPAMQFCMFTVYEDDEKIFKSLQAGAKGYILKSSSNEVILSSIRELYRGGSPMSPSIARRVLDAFQKMNTHEETVQLPITARERELLEFLAQGLLYKEIADEMNITTGTVKQHIHKIYDKLQVNNRTEAVNKLRHNS
jgi:DNA-binding NarL/FixJ family response regulator